MTAADERRHRADPADGQHHPRQRREHGPDALIETLCQRSTLMAYPAGEAVAHEEKSDQPGGNPYRPRYRGDYVDAVLLASASHARPPSLLAP